VPDGRRAIDVGRVDPATDDGAVGGDLGRTVERVARELELRPGALAGFALGPADGLAAPAAVPRHADDGLAVVADVPAGAGAAFAVEVGGVARADGGAAERAERVPAVGGEVGGLERRALRADDAAGVRRHAEGALRRQRRLVRIAHRRVGVGGVAALG